MGVRGRSSQCIDPDGGEVNRDEVERLVSQVRSEVL